MPAKKTTETQSPKKRKNSRAKGKGFERVVAKLLTAWWGAEFHSTPASGGLRWGNDARVVGDIVAPSEGGEDYPFSNECKKVEGWSLEQLIKGTGQITDWWEQCTRDAKVVSKVPLLTFSKNRSPIYYMMPYEAFQRLGMLERNYFITTFELKGVEHCVAVGFFDSLLAIPKEEVIKKLVG